ncbi:MAG: transposase [Phycisphaerae bacterium]
MHSAICGSPTYNHFRYTCGAVRTNHIENFCAIMHWMLAGTYVACELFHLERYPNEQAFRFILRKMTDAERFVRALEGATGKRLTYAELTGKVETPVGAAVLRNGGKEERENPLIRIDGLITLWSAFERLACSDFSCSVVRWC